MKITFSGKVLRDDKIITIDTEEKKQNLKLFPIRFLNSFKIIRELGLKTQNGQIIRLLPFRLDFILMVKKSWVLC